MGGTTAPVASSGPKPPCMASVSKDAAFRTSASGPSMRTECVASVPLVSDMHACYGGSGAPVATLTCSYAPVHRRVLGEVGLLRAVRDVERLLAGAQQTQHDAGRVVRAVHQHT